MKSNNLNRLLTNKEIDAILKQERARSDRSDHEFSLIAFDIGKESKDKKFLTDFCKLLESQLRSIDNIGWVNLAQIGVVLPYTSAENASLLAKRIQRELKSTNHSLIVNIFSYPSIVPLKKKNGKEKIHTEVESG